MLTSLCWKLWRPAPHVCLIEDRIRTHVGWHRSEHLFFAINQIGRVESREFKSMTVGDGIGGASLDAISTENATVIVDVVNLCITLCPAHPVLFRVLGSLYVDAVGWTIGRA